jgi:hypothetical protein
LERDHSGKIEQALVVRSSNETQIQSNIAPPAPNNRHLLVELFRSAEVDRFTSSTVAASALSGSELLRLFEEQSKTASRRGLHRSYFVGHTGSTTSGLPTNRREEHLTIAIWRRYRESGFRLPDGTILFPIDYQLPLKSHRDEANDGLGKIDLFCVECEGEPWITEVKIHSTRSRRIETPLKALLEALTYCAILDANLMRLSKEAHDRKNILQHAVKPTRPNLLILAPTEYWNLCSKKENRHPWRESFLALGRRIEIALKIRVRFVRIDNCHWEMTSAMPRLIESPVFEWAIPNG